MLQSGEGAGRRGESRAGQGGIRSHAAKNNAELLLNVAEENMLRDPNPLQSAIQPPHPASIRTLKQSIL